MKPNLPQRARRWLRWFFASGTRLIALFLLAIGLPGVIPGPFGGLFPSELVRFHTAISAELVGMALAVLLIDTANELRSEHERKDELILQMGSDNNVLVKEAVRILRLKGWLEDGTLRGANLMHANLQGAHLRDADLQEACLDFAKLEGANLYRADLRSATLVIASLAGAALKDAKLDGAMLFHTNLKGAKLVTRDQLRQAMILYATLPDGRLVPAHDARVLPYTGLQVHIDESTDGRPRFMPQVLVLAGGERVPIEDYVRPGFDEWCRTVAIDKDGFIVPAPLDESDE